MRFFGGRRSFEPYEFSRLATYNSEVARGIVHTPEWKVYMAEEQERFNQQQRELYPDAIWVEPVQASFVGRSSKGEDAQTNWERGKSV